MSLRILGLATGALMIVGWTAKPSAATPRSTDYMAEMTGGVETPPNNAKGSGDAKLTVDGKKLNYSISVKDLSGAPTAAHIHVGARGVAGPPVYTFAIKAGSGTSGKIAEGTIDLTRDASAGVSGDSLKALLANGNAYVNVHTKNFPNGEVRGQVTMKP